MADKRNITILTDAAEVKGQLAAFMKQLLEQVQKLKEMLLQKTAQNKAEMEKMVADATATSKVLAEKFDTQTAEMKAASRSDSRTAMRYIDDSVNRLRRELPPPYDDDQLRAEIAEVRGLIPTIPDPFDATNILNRLDDIEEELEELRKEGKKLGGTTRVIGHVQTFANSILPASGDLDNSNVTFGFAQKPTMINVNGAFYAEGHGWSWVNQQAVLDVPAGTGGHIFGVQ